MLCNWQFAYNLHGTAFIFIKNLKELMQVKQTDVLDLLVFYGELIDFQ